MLESKSRTWLEIDLEKLKKNTKIIADLIGDTKIMAVVKANAYGHGDIQVAQVLQNEMNIDFFAVSSVDEAVVLRENGIMKSILILGYTPQEHFHYLHELDITQCLLSKEYAIKLNKYAKSMNVRIKGHVKIDTGMSRIGIPCLDNYYNIDDVISIYKLDHIDVKGIFSHFSVSDSLDDVSDVEYTNHQIELFERVLNDLSNHDIDYGLTHIQNSYGCLNYFDLHYDYARPGIILLGSTSDDSYRLRKPIEIEPILEWKANVSLVKTVKKGTCVSYGRHYVAKEDMKVASLSVGYADGLNRNASNKGTCVLIKGVRCPIIGNICMDQCLVDVSKVEEINEGDVAILVGRSEDQVITIDELSRNANTINNESFCLLSKRVPRFYK